MKESNDKTPEDMSLDAKSVFAGLESEKVCFRAVCVSRF